jgi:dihydroorotate dehydrogenase
MYLGLSLFGVRRGLHWAQQSVYWSAFVGLATFFLFLGYGYFDPFHAFVTNVLLQFLLLAIHSKLGPAPVPDAPQLAGDWRWRAGLWGQLILIGHAAGLIVAGLTIATFGITRVFVPEDLEFMRTTSEALEAANPRLLPLIAHDRASFGGNLVSVGLCLLLPALWGVRPASAWLWWTMLLAVVPGYAAAITVHLVVGYTDLWHLTPAYGGLAVFLLGMALLRPFLCQPGASEEEWRRYRQGSSAATGS